MMTLHDTIPMMESPDYKARFRAEYWQTKIRYDKLHQTIQKYEDGALEFEPSNPIDLLKDQRRAMLRYLTILQVRAGNEGIELK